MGRLICSVKHAFVSQFGSGYAFPLRMRRRYWPTGFQTGTKGSFSLAGKLPHCVRSFASHWSVCAVGFLGLVSEHFESLAQAEALLVDQRKGMPAGIGHDGFLMEVAGLPHKVVIQMPIQRG